MSLITSKGFVLRDLSSQRKSIVKVGDIIRHSDGRLLTIIGGTAPRHEGSSGRVYASQPNGYKVEVKPESIGCGWVQSEDHLV